MMLSADISQDSNTEKTMNKKIIPKLIAGDKVDRLLILSIISPVSKSRTPRMAKCLCDCGKECVKRYHDIRYGRIHSCGCLRAETWEGHGGAYTLEYNSWLNMKQRCLNKDSQDYHYYGARGITVCDRWKNSFQNFIDDMGKRPNKKLTLDRINNDGNYEPSNCKWSTRSEQTFNQRRSRVSATKLCITCGIEFKVSPSNINTTKNCSWMCRNGKNKGN